MSLDGKARVIFAKFADGTKLFSTGKTKGDCKEFQKDLSRLIEWAVKQQMKFCVNKCNSGTGWCKTKNLNFSYTLHGVWTGDDRPGTRPWGHSGEPDEGIDPVCGSHENSKFYARDHEERNWIIMPLYKEEATIEVYKIMHYHGENG